MSGLGRIMSGKPWESNDIMCIDSMLPSGKTIDEFIIHKDRYKNTPLIMAAKHCFPKVVIFSLLKGANILDKNKYGRNPIMEASMCIEMINPRFDDMHNDVSIIKKNNMKKKYIEIIEILLLKGDNINDIDIKGNTAMIIASNFGNTEVVEVLKKWTLILENNWSLKMLILVLQELFVYHHLDCESFIDFNQYFE